MAEEDMKYSVPDQGGKSAEAAGPRQVPVTFSGRRVPTSYASAFQAQVMDGLVCLTYGVSFPQGQGRAVDMERRVVMTPQAAARLVNAVARLLQSSGKGEASKSGAAPAPKAAEIETFGQNE